MIDLGYPARGLAYIRHITTAETYANSPIVIPIQAREKVAAQQFIVTAVGNYERCEDVEECPRHHNKQGEHVHHLTVGAWVLVRNRAWMSTPDPNVFVVRQDAILGKFVER
jgi:co-chaperonin GroES (HSP10)